MLRDGCVATALAMILVGAAGSCSGDLVGASGDGGTGPGNNNCQAPSCVTNFQASVRSCAPMGSCVEQVSMTGGDICWANGTKEHVTSAPNSTYHADVTGPDRSLCFSIDFQIDPFALTYIDRFGQVVFKARVNSDESTTIECPGQSPVTFPRSCSMSNMMMPVADSMCTMGTCLP
jgi:hypothetical protein